MTEKHEIARLIKYYPKGSVEVAALQLLLSVVSNEKIVHTPLQLQYMMCEGVVDILQKQLDEFGKAVDSLKTN